MVNVTAAERVADHAVKWLGLLVAILTLMTLWESHRLHKLEMAERLENGGL